MKVEQNKREYPIKIYLDSHIDTLFQVSKYGYHHNIQNRFDFNINIERLLIGRQVNAYFFVLYRPQIEENYIYRMFNLLYQYIIFNEIITDNQSILDFSKSPNDILTTIYNHKISISLGLENGISISKITLLQFYYNIGVRYITLCHNQSNQICDSSTDTSIHGGLSKFGYDVVQEMNKLGIMIDISHLSNASVENILDISIKPVIASHSCAYSLCRNARNLNNRLLKGIAANGGVVQVTLLPKCVGQTRDMVSFVNHIDYIRNIIGIDHIGIGSDFDGGGGIVGCKDISQAGNIIIELRKRRYTENEIDKILGLNFLRVYQQNFNKEEKK